MAGNLDEVGGVQQVCLGVVLDFPTTMLSWRRSSTEVESLLSGIRVIPRERQSVLSDRPWKDWSIASPRPFPLESQYSLFRRSSAR